MKKFANVIFILFLLIGIFHTPVSAVDVNRAIWVGNNSTIKIVGPSPDVKSNTICREDKLKVKKVILPDHIKEIGNGAFENCRNLESINIPNGCKSIGDSAFAYCKNLKSINIPNGCKSIGDSAFAYCENLKSINIPDTVTTIGSSAFEYCKNLKNISIPDKLHSFSPLNCTFQYCVNLEQVNFYKSKTPQEFFFPNTPQTIKYAKNPGELVKYPINEYYNVTIGQEAFKGCTSLKSIKIPDTVKVIGIEAFYNCTSLEEVIIPNSVTHIGVAAFYNCTSLKKVIIPNSVICIKAGAFYNCTSLKSIKIPNSKCEIFERTLGYNTDSMYETQKFEPFKGIDTVYYNGSKPWGTKWGAKRVRKY